MVECRTPNWEAVGSNSLFMLVCVPEQDMFKIVHPLDLEPTQVMSCS